MRPSERTLWTWQVISGLALLALLGFHMAILHLSGAPGLAGFNPAAGHPIDWANVVHRARQTAFALTYVLLLAAALFHGLNGLRTILFETVRAARLRTVLVAVLAAVGAGLLVLGTWAAFAARSLALAADLTRGGP